jgi:hypothetical protein
VPCGDALGEFGQRDQVTHPQRRQHR